MAARTATVAAYYNADRTKVVGAGDPAAAYLLINEGGDMSYLNADDLAAYEAFVAQGTKAVTQPPANKAATTKDTK